jgi:hypothetical protein
MWRGPVVSEAIVPGIKSSCERLKVKTLEVE